MTRRTGRVNLERMRLCTLCSRWLPLSKFVLDGKASHGRRHQCRKCVTAQNRARRRKKRACSTGFGGGDA